MVTYFVPAYLCSYVPCLGEGSEYIPFWIWAFHHKTSRPTGGAKNLERFILRPFTCRKKWLFYFMFVFVHEIFVEIWKGQLIATEEVCWPSFVFFALSGLLIPCYWHLQNMSSALTWEAMKDLALEISCKKDKNNASFVLWNCSQ